MLPRLGFIVAVAAVLTVGVQSAGGKPAAPSGAPAISGHAGYLSLLKCSPGTWGAEATSFTYAWHFKDTGDLLGEGTEYRAERRTVARYVICRVTASDGSGQTTSADSPQVYIRAGKTTIKVKAKSPQEVSNGKVTLTGTVGPIESIAPMEGRTSRGRIVAYRQGKGKDKGRNFQLFGKYKLDAKTGKFSIVAPDQYGKNTYQVNYHANELSMFESSNATKTVTLKRKPKRK